MLLECDDNFTFVHLSHSGDINSVKCPKLLVFHQSALLPRLWKPARVSWRPGRLLLRRASEQAPSISSSGDSRTAAPGRAASHTASLRARPCVSLLETVIPDSLGFGQNCSCLAVSSFSLTPWDVRFL